MRKNICGLVFLIAIILVVQPVFAISSNMKDSYLPGETIVIKISGNILEPISSGNVEFRRGHILVPFDYDLKKLGEDYYLWAIAPESQINYTLTIKEISTYVSGKVQKIDYVKNFSILGNLSDYSIKPGFVLDDKDFEIKMQLNEDINKPIDLKFIEEREVVLKPGENIVKFSISEINETGLYNLTIGKYILPAYLKINKSVSKIVENITIGNLTNVSLAEIDVENLSEQEKEAVNVERAKYHCYEFPGKICTADQTCSGETIVSMDGACCLGDCGAKTAEGGSSAWIGYLIAAIVIIAGIFIWIRYKKIKAEKNPLEKKILSLEKKIP